ncbi:TIR domain-containing protein [Pyxidicoccus parkwayensis]|uniref:TIR domain-containing protein n=1 Tax=Pyxidicoccus parkwayensis TaxID=2813578 RepID=A0ABX7P8K0_9BACT|nr:NB-ARC domain-containing protein [Pyxidicoccus parkwaysis]QSQ26780.1 TIR domain-containing protein [Pyxidicoccus parkwaysis]
MAAPDRWDVFISYARDDDEPFVKRLHDFLCEQGVQVWWDRAAMQSRGTTFLQEIRRAIESADRVLLVIGPRARHSAYVEAEWRHALTRGTVVTPILRLGTYKDVPEAVSALHCEDCTEAVPEGAAFSSVLRLVRTPVAPMGKPFGVPRRPSPFIERNQQLDQLRKRVLVDAYRPIELEPDQRITVATGMSGAGKSVLAAALVTAPDVLRSFPDGVFWLLIGRRPNVLETLRAIGTTLGDSNAQSYETDPSAKVRLSVVLADKRCLLVLDDVWSVEIVEALHTAASRDVRILITSQKRRLFASSGVHEVHIDELNEDESLKLLAGWVGLPVEALPDVAAEIVKECGRLPLAISMIGAMLRRRRPDTPPRWDQALARLKSADPSSIAHRLPDYAHESIERALLVGFDDLSEVTRARFVDLAAFPEDAAVPVRVVHTWWEHEQFAPIVIDDLVQDLADRSLIQFGAGDTFLVHDLVRDFLLARAEEASVQQRLLAALAAPTGGNWANSDEPYVFEHLAYHLERAHRSDEWAGLLVSFSWLLRKMEKRGVSSVILDLDRAAVSSSGNRSITTLLAVCRSVAHLLAHEPSQFAPQLLARVDESEQEEMRPLLDAARAWAHPAWLRPRTASLSRMDSVVVTFRGREADGHRGTPRSVVFSADGLYLATAGNSANDRTIKVWDLTAHRLLRTFNDAADAGGVTVMSFLPGARLAAAGLSGIQVYDLADASSVPYPITVRVTSIVPIAARDRMLVGFDDGRVAAVGGNDASATLREPDGSGVYALAVNDDGTSFACVTDSAVECRQLPTGALMGALPGRVESASGLGFGGRVVAFDSSRRLVFGSPLQTWSVGEPVATPRWPGQTDGVVALTPTGSHALLLDPSGERLGVRATGAEATAAYTNAHPHRFSCVAIAPDGALAASCDYEHDVVLWDLTRPAAASGPNRPAVFTARLDDECRRAFLSVKDEDPHTVELETLVQVPLAGPFIRRGTDLFDRELYAAVRAELTRREPPSEDPRSSIALVGNIAFASGARRALSAPSSRSKGADVEEGPTPATANDWYAVRLWELGATTPPRMLHGHTMTVRALDITRNGRFGISGSKGRMIRVWDLDTGTCLRVLRGHRGAVYSVAITEDGRLAVSGSEDMTLRLWDVASGALLSTFTGVSAVLSCDISRDGSVVIAGERSGRIHVLDVAGNRQIERADAAMS